MRHLWIFISESNEQLLKRKNGDGHFTSSLPFSLCVILLFWHRFFSICDTACDTIKAILLLLLRLLLHQSVYLLHDGKSSKTFFIFRFRFSSSLRCLYSRSISISSSRYYMSFVISCGSSHFVSS